MYEPIIGLEIHAELKTKTKMFCDCLNDIEEKHPNVHICPVCMGHPGALPTINKHAVEDVLRVGLAMGGEIAEKSKFDRKNYFYPDLPKGYQISQYDQPLVRGGTLHIKNEVIGIDKKILLTRIHLEEDTARMVHTTVNSEARAAKRKGQEAGSLIDFNRSGVPLMELVTEPEIRSAEEARLFAEEFRTLVRYLDVSGADMEKGEMRIEANISVRPQGETVLPQYKVEVKNINSFHAVEAAVKYEIERHTKLLKAGKTPIQETRGWRDDTGVTESQRHKEKAHDYRYFPEPDLPPLDMNEFDIDSLGASLPELPDQKLERFRKEFYLSFEDAYFLTRDREMADYFENAISELREDLNDARVPGPVPEEIYRKGVAALLNYFTSDVRGMMNESGFSVRELRITPAQLADLVTMIIRGDISSRIAKDLLSEMFITGGDPHEIIKEKGMEQVSDEAIIVETVKKVIGLNPKAVEDYKKGKENAIQFLFGQTMRELRGSGNPEKIREALARLLRE